MVGKCCNDSDVHFDDNLAAIVLCTRRIRLWDRGECCFHHYHETVVQFRNFIPRVGLKLSCKKIM